MRSSRNSGDTGLPPACGRQALCRGYGGVPQTLLGREGGKKNVDVSARTPTPPIAHNAPPTSSCNEMQTAKRGTGRAGRPTCGFAERAYAIARRWPHML